MKKKLKVLSLFDGMSCGQIALKKLGFTEDMYEYYASEIDKHAIKVTQHNFPNTIQIGDVTKVKIKLLCLSEVYSYICNYDSNLQSNISEWEVLYWLNKDFTLSAKIRTQKPNERQEVSEPSTVQRIEEVWFSNREMGSVRKFGDYTTSRRNGEENDIRTPQQLQCGKWGYDNDIYRRYKKENIGIASRETKNGDSEKKNFRNIEEAIFKGRESEGCFRENEKGNVEKRCSGELFEGKREDRFSREVEKEKRNRRTKEGNFINEVIRELCRWDETDGITQDYWRLLRLHKEEQVTVVEHEKGFYIFKGRIDLCIGGSPCQNFSFAGTRKGMITKDNIEIVTLEQYLSLKEEGFKFEGQSFLFWEYVRLLKESKPTIFLLENVRMSDKWKKLLSSVIGINPIYINSNLVSAQSRPRLYWTNVPNFILPTDRNISFQSFREDLPLRPVGSWVFSSWGDKVKLDSLKTLDTIKLNCLTTSKTHSYMYYTNLEKTMYRNLSLKEAKYAQTIPEWYDMSNVPEGKAFQMLGNGWTVDVIVEFFRPLVKEYVHKF